MIVASLPRCNRHAWCIYFIDSICDMLPSLIVPPLELQRIEESCNENNVRGAFGWRAYNDGIGHKTNNMKNLLQARKAEWYVWKTLKSMRHTVSEPNFERDQKASADMKIMLEKEYNVEVKSVDKRKRDKNGYQIQIRRKRKNKLIVVDPYTKNKTGGDTLFFCVIVDKNKCSADTIFGMKRKDLILSEPNRVDLRGLKKAIHPRLQKSKNFSAIYCHRLPSNYD